MCRDVPTSRDHKFVVPRSLDIIFGSGVSPDALLSIAGRHIAIRALTMARHTKKLANPYLSLNLKLPCSYTAYMSRSKESDNYRIRMIHVANFWTKFKTGK